jgi:hypothetical protein
MAVVIPTKPTSGLPNDERGMWNDEGHGAPDWGCCSAGGGQGRLRSARGCDKGHRGEDVRYGFC